MPRIVASAKHQRHSPLTVSKDTLDLKTSKKILRLVKEQQDEINEK